MDWKDIVVPGLSALGGVAGYATRNPLLASTASVGAGYLGEKHRQDVEKEKADLVERQRRFQRMSDFATQAQQDPSNPMLQGFANYYSKLAAGGLPSSQQLSDLESIYSNTAPELEKSQFVAAGRKAQAGEDIKSNTALNQRVQDIQGTWPARGPNGEPPVFGPAAEERAKEQLATEHMGERPVEMPLPGQAGKSVYVSPAQALSSASRGQKPEERVVGGTLWQKGVDGTWAPAPTSLGDIVTSPEAITTRSYTDEAGGQHLTRLPSKGPGPAEAYRGKGSAGPATPGSMPSPPKTTKGGGGGDIYLGKKAVPFTTAEKTTLQNVDVIERTLKQAVADIEGSGLGGENGLLSWGDNRVKGLLMKAGKDPDPSGFFADLEQGLKFSQLQELRTMVGGNRPAVALLDEVKGYTPDMAKQTPAMTLRMAKGILRLLQYRKEAITASPSFKGQASGAGSPMPPAPAAPTGAKVDFIYDEKGNLSPAP